MGGDYGPRFCILAVLDFLKQYPSARVSLFGNPKEISSLVSNSVYLPRISVVACDDVVAMTDSPVFALRNRQQSSMWHALSALNLGRVSGCVSGGNTGALVAMSSHLLTTLGGLKRPVICTSIPSEGGKSFLLDMGANISCSAEQLAGFAVLGRLFAESAGVVDPKVALLNVGVEQGKGLPLLTSAAKLIESDKKTNFVGFVEGDELFTGRVDVIVCDGFTGNIALKSSEGAAKFLLASLRREFQSGVLSLCLGAIVRPLLKRWAYRYYPSQFNGAVLLGLNRTVVKSHGSADQLGFFRALETAFEHCTKQTSENMSLYFTCE